MNIDHNLPGSDLVAKGLENIQNGESTAEALLVFIGAPRLRQLGIAVPKHEMEICPELALYHLLLKRDKENAYSLYNSYLRRLISFEKASEQIYYKKLQ